MEQQERVTGALSAWTEDLMGAINILGNDGLDDESFETTYRDFKAVQHLFFVPCILDLTEPYMDDNSVNSDEPIHFAQYQPTVTRSTSPSESIRLTPPLTGDLQDPDHPGEGWVRCYDPSSAPILFSFPPYLFSHVTFLSHGLSLDQSPDFHHMTALLF